MQVLFLLLREAHPWNALINPPQKNNRSTPEQMPALVFNLNICNN
jgi:hypothetical protein